MKNKLAGFTLVELMISIAIIALLLSIAIPSYLQHVRKSKRAEAQGALVSFANAMEVWRLQNNGSYLGAAAGSAATGAPSVFSTVVPISGGRTTYNLTINAATASTYTLRATPVTGPQAVDGWLAIDNFGTKTCEVAASCLNGTSW